MKRSLRKNIIITGGSGYIGAHIVYILFKLKKYNIIVLDKNTHPFIKKHKIQFFKTDLRNYNKLDKIFKKIRPFLVIHLSGLAFIEESFKKKKLYEKNNQHASLNVLNVMKNYNCKNILFSSSCLVYGNKNLKDENFNELSGLSPYAKNKIYVENKIKLFSQKHSFNFCIMRFFNVAGVLGGKYKIGFNKISGNRIIPIILNSIIKNKTLNINGGNFKTFDGTAIRDFIHPLDIAEFTKKIIKNFEKKKFNEIVNLGSGSGYSIKQLIKISLKITNKKKVKIFVKKKRKGDAPILKANIQKVKKKFNWKPINSNINKIIKSSYEWIDKN